jgi:prevent-host-death family protein
MQSIGIRELKEHTSQVLRRVREKGQSLQVTYRGQVIALILPAASSKPKVKDLEKYWTDLDQLSAEISAHCPPRISATDTVREGRREL